MGNTTMTEFRLFDAPGAEVAQITTDGATIKPYLNVIRTVENEAKIHVTEDGLQTTVVDPANVFMVDVSVPADAFEDYEVFSEATIGGAVKEMQRSVRRARKGHSDELTLSIQERELTATVSRGYENNEVVSQSRMDLIDPDAIRTEPDFPDLDIPVDITVDTAPFMDAFAYGIESAERARFETKAVNQHAAALYIGGETDIRSDHAAIGDIETEAYVSGLYSTDYLSDLQEGLNYIGAEELRLRLGDSFPMFVSAENESIAAEFVLAPRVERDD